MFGKVAIFVSFYPAPRRSDATIVPGYTRYGQGLSGTFWTEIRRNPLLTTITPNLTSSTALKNEYTYPLTGAVTSIHELPIAKVFLETQGSGLKGFSEVREKQANLETCPMRHPTGDHSSLLCCFTFTLQLQFLLAHLLRIMHVVLTTNVLLTVVHGRHANEDVTG
jgi:hypothetical protein